jgi:hypothetical protein
VSTAGGSERESIVYRKFAAGGSDAIALPARPLALICDTLETVFARGETTTYDFGEWLEGLVRIFGATDVRAVLAGRDPLGADSRVNICAFLGGRGHRVAPDIRLEDLAPDDAKELLLDAGIDDETVARAAAMALPGNPLVLRVAGEVFSNAPAALLDEIRREYHAGRIDRETASRYLTQRVVIHVPDQVAQRYVLAAMVLPEVTEKLIREIVIPVVDGESIAQRTSGLAKRVYAALSQASWLVKPSFDGMSFTFHPALRTLVLKLMDADAKLSDLRGRVRAAAIVWHRGKRTPKDRAFALYHRLMRGDQIGPDVGDLAQLLAPLPVPFLDDLPEPRRKALTESGVDIGGTGQTATRETDNEWKAYVEGLGERDGQGDKLVKSGRAEQALALYRERPTREPGVPPTFFIQALADHAEWDTDEVDRDRVLAEVESACRASGERISGVMLSRIYWLTRYELLRRPRRLEPEHMRVLRLVAERVSPSGRFLVMPSLIALAEAFARQRVAPPTWIGTKGSIQSETRLFLVHALYADKPFTAKPNLDALIVTQRDWARCVRSVAGSIIGSVQKRKPDLDAAQRQISALHRAPFSEVGRTMRELRQPLELNFSEIDPEAAILLLRGATVEFNRPLTSALTACAKEANQGLRREPVWRALGATLSRMSILPREFHDDFLRELVASNPREWFGSTVSFIDRSRLLPELCLRVVKLVPTDTPARRRLVRIAKTFLKWESALCDGGSSVWRPE